MKNNVFVRSIAMLLCACIFCIPAEIHALKGDLAPRGAPDGQLNTADLLIMQRIIQGEIPAAPVELVNGDLFPPDSPDGSINTSDWILLNKIVLQGGQSGVPVAVDDPAAATTPEDTPVTTVNVLANDTLVDNAVISSFDTTSTNSLQANISSNGDGTFFYTPPPNFSGSDNFSYTLIDDQGDTSSATVTVTVTAINDVPVANTDAFTIAEDGILSGNVLTDNGNGADNPGDEPSSVAQGSGNTGNGTLTLNADGTFTYTPNPNFNGTDSFSYTVTDSTPETSNEATATITVTAVNDVPVASPDSFTVSENDTLNGNVLMDNGNGADNTGDEPASIAPGSTTISNGNLSLNANGSFSYTPNPGFTGTDSFSYTLTDSTPEISNEALVIITVTDSTPPGIVVTSPSDGSSVTGVVTLDATATDNVGIQSVQFFLDGTNLGPADTTAPYSTSWDTGNSANGNHVLTAIALDLAGNQSTSAAVVVTLSSSGVSDPAVIGQWSSQIVGLPTVAVNLILLHTGKLLFWAGDFATAPNFGELWDPETNQITPVPNPFSNIFCSANIGLADGRILVAGGHDVQAGSLGIAEANTFDPATESWNALPSMSFKRWYPTLTALGDGRAIITSGSETSESVFVEIPEIYDPVTNTWSQLGSAPMSIPQYPMMYLLPDGRLLQSGTTEHPTDTKILDIDTQQWTVIDSSVLEGGSGVMYEPGRIMKSGSASNDGATPTAPSSATTYVLDMNAPSPAWRQTASMAFARTFLNLTSLPDGSVLASSGSGVKSETNLTPAVLEAELWSPATETWTTMAPMQTPRIYHSTAVLLPDGRVAVSGSGNIPGGTDMLNLEIYSPPYLFKGPRPAITSVASRLAYGSSFTVATPDAADISAVNLVRLGAATHNFDQNQRFVPLSFVQNTGALEVQAPANTNLVPPGYYMLFLINSAGVPSVAEFVRFPAGYEDSEPPGAPGNLTVSGSLAAASLNWDAAVDNSGISGYEVHRAATSGFAPSGATRVGQPTTTSFTDSGLPGGTWFYVVTAVDIAGNIGPVSAEVAITVAGDTTAPTVALTTPVDSALLSNNTVVTADASDNASIAGVQFILDGLPLGNEDTTAPYSYSWNTFTTPNGPHVLTAVARDVSNNTAVSTPVDITVSNALLSGLVAAWDFEEGSGTSTADSSGNANTGTISGASWTSNGRFGSALSFDGVNDWVTVADAASLDLTDGMTLEAWVYPTSLSGWRTVVMKEMPGELAYTLYANDNAPRSSGLIRVSGGSVAVQGGNALPLNTWTHLALTYDGALLQLYENGTEVGTTTVSGNIEVSAQPLRIGGNQIWGEYFSGRIDAVKIFNRALSAAEIQAEAGASGPTVPAITITQPGNNSSVPGPNIDINYTTSGDLADVSHAHFSLDGGPDVMDPPPLDGIFQFTGVDSGPHTIDAWLVRDDHSKITGSDAATVSITVPAPNTVPPTVVLLTPGDGNTLEGTITINASASDDLGVAGVQFMLDGLPLGSEDTQAPYAYSWNTGTVAPGTYVLTAVARDASNNTSESIPINIIVSQSSASLVAAWGFEEGSGSTTMDSSGSGNTATISGASWITTGRFGNALSFDGVNDWLTVADANSLDLTNGMTLEAWVYPTALGGWRTVIMKEIPGELAYTLYANDNAPRSSGLIRVGGGNVTAPGNNALPLNAWTHLAVTYDNTTMRLYENGAEVSAVPVTGNIEISTQPLRIGGNQIWGEYFSGRIDEVRIYNRALDAAELQVRMNTPVVTPQPTRSSPITVDPAGRRTWLVNPDNDSVAAIGADSLLLEQEISVGAHPSSVALDKFGRLWVTCQDDDSVWILDATSGAVLKVLALPWGSAPVAIVFSPNGVDGYISATGSGLIQQVDAASQTLSGSLDVGTTPRALAITADGQRMLVTQFISTDSAGGTVRSIDLSTFSASGTLQLPLDTTSVDGSLAGRGLPNYLSGIAIHPQNSLAWVAAKKDNILRGQFRDGQPLTFETSVRSMIGLLDLNLDVEHTDQRLDIDNHGQPSSIAISESGEHIFVTMQGNNRLLVLNQLGAEITRVDTGLAPQGVVIDPVSKRIFTKDLMSRTVTIFDASGLLDAGASTLTQLGQVQTVSNESMSPAILLGKRIFYNAADPRMSRDSYISCAICHLDGEHDGRTWDFTDRGEGLRNTISLNGQGGSAGTPLHWTGNFDEVQDFENDIRNAFGGSGFMDDTDFLAGTRSDPLGDPKAGLSPELDALAAYVDSLIETGRSPHRLPDGNMTPDALAGQALFTSLGCQACHSGVRFSDSSTGVRHDVGTIKPSSGQRRGAPLDGFDTPMLAGLWASAPYLHDGSASSLLEVLTTANATGQHDSGVTSLTSAELNQLVEYLLQIELP